MSAIVVSKSVYFFQNLGWSMDFETCLEVLHFRKELFFEKTLLKIISNSSKLFLVITI